MKGKEKKGKGDGDKGYWDDVKKLLDPLSQAMTKNGQTDSNLCSTMKEANKAACQFIVKGLKHIYGITRGTDSQDQQFVLNNLIFHRTMSCVLLNAFADKLEKLKDEKSCDVKKGIDHAFKDEGSLYKSECKDGPCEQCKREQNIGDCNIGQGKIGPQLDKMLQEKQSKIEEMKQALETACKSPPPEPARPSNTQPTEKIDAPTPEITEKPDPAVPKPTEASAAVHPQTPGAVSETAQSGENITGSSTGGSEKQTPDKQSKSEESGEGKCKANLKNVSANNGPTGVSFAAGCTSDSDLGLTEDVQRMLDAQEAKGQPGTSVVYFHGTEQRMHIQSTPKEFYMSYIYKCIIITFLLFTLQAQKLIQVRKAPLSRMTQFPIQDKRLFTPMLPLEKLKTVLLPILELAQNLFLVTVIQKEVLSNHLVVVVMLAIRVLFKQTLQWEDHNVLYRGKV
ncbi:SICA antigen [Plasmodium coatneyi]|uniref:SICA antigen n=1 Tax=Plasmodium coatneyi TaxID=208452 RepID=A0A1B1E2S8_9APIC|nr:SICA antigen [Plasmodium coatneyi]ANQ09314.1 SICA antigen [Plasmodium coatneyi]